MSIFKPVFLGENLGNAVVSIFKPVFLGESLGNAVVSIFKPGSLGENVIFEVELLTNFGKADVSIANRLVLLFGGSPVLIGENRIDFMVVLFIILYCRKIKNLMIISYSNIVQTTNKPW